MLKPQLNQTEQLRSISLLRSSRFSGSHGSPSLPICTTPAIGRTPKSGRISIASRSVKAVLSATEKSVAVKAIVTVKLTIGGIFSNIGLNRGLDDITDLLGKTLCLELISAELDPKTGCEKETIKDFAHKADQDDFEVKYQGDFVVPANFGEIGGIYVTNEHRKEMYLKDIVLTGFPSGPVNITCDSWIHSFTDSDEKRVFFTNKSYLPSQTPSALQRLREEELVKLRGNGEGERKTFERIYDYDTYNDLGDPDTSEDLKRPVLGGAEHPYPRRCRTGRPRTEKDPLSESRADNVYVPRDEAFSEVKNVSFQVKTVRSVLKSVIPGLGDSKLDFPYFTAIDTLYDEGVDVKLDNKGFFKLVLPRLLKAVNDAREEILLFETPELIDRDKFAWLRDEELGRQALAGLNPLTIQLVKEFPFVSKLDPEIYGPPDSLITKEIIECEIKGYMTLEEALECKRLFILDFHDVYLPYVHKVRELEDTTLYGSRTVFFLTNEGTLRPLAIELTRPVSPTKPQWRHVFTPCWDATNSWLWKIAKAHVIAHDTGFHQLVSHWLRTHACVEPYIIAANRQLSAMHPIYRLLSPHFRYTMEINGNAREALINGGGIIESSFSPGKYSMELSSVAYDLLWRFDTEALPADLISRGMAVEDPRAEHGIKLTIEDYPYANDGLLVWSAIKEWVNDYVNYFYPDSCLVSSDTELQEWWTEVRTKGHGDKKDEPWWPVLETPGDLVQILTTIIWVASAHHAAVNFGQYHYAGYFPNRPTIARKNVPIEDASPDELKQFLKKPESALLECFPSKAQATKVMAILDVLSTHSPDEEYLGDVIEPAWTECPKIVAAFERFNGRLKEIEGVIDERNVDTKLKNRMGAGVIPYELLKPYSKPGVTGMGVPNSISI